MPQSRVLDPGSSLLAFFGAELRRRRAAAGTSQEQLGQAINYSAALVGRIEIGERVPSPEFARRCDEVLSAEGLFAHLRDSMNSDVHAYPTWFWEFVEREREATSIREFNALAVPGLLQTEEYARALFRACKPADSVEEISRHVAARLERQRILGRPKPPMLWAVVDEGVLRRPVGGPEIFRSQLAHLARVGQRPGTVFQVMPFSAGAHAGLLGEFIVLGLPNGRDLAYTESVESARLIEQPDEVAAFNLVFDMIRAVALSPETSLDFVAQVQGEISDGPRSGRVAEK
jgi:transcriptional regulator with XRE-family HTH domain